MSYQVVGLDISGTAVRAVELKISKKSKPELIRYHEIKLEDGDVVSGEIIEKERVRLALKQLWLEGKFKSRYIVLGTGNHKTIVRDIKVNSAPLKHIKQSLPFQIADKIQTNVDDSVIDFYPVANISNEKEQTTAGLLIVVEKTSLMSNLDVIESAGLIPKEIDIIPFALNRLLLADDQSDENTALIDIGKDSTNIIISYNGVPHFVRIIPTGGEELSKALRASLELDNTKTEDLKRALILGTDLEESSKLSMSTSKKLNCNCDKCTRALSIEISREAVEVMQGVLDDLLQSIKSTLTYYNNLDPNAPDHTVNKIIITGGAAQMSGLALALSEVTSIPVLQADPYSKISLVKGLDTIKLQQNHTGITVALGLASRSFSK